MLPLRSVGRFNFVRVCVNLTTLIKKRHILMRTAVLYNIYVYIYNTEVLIKICRFSINVVKFMQNPYKILKLIRTKIQFRPLAPVA